MESPNQKTSTRGKTSFETNAIMSVKIRDIDEDGTSPESLKHIDKAHRPSKYEYILELLRYSSLGRSLIGEDQKKYAKFSECISEFKIRY